jgi:hypothetical protein
LNSQNLSNLVGLQRDSECERSSTSPTSTSAGWTAVALNNYIPVAAGSEQWSWLREDLAVNTERCTVVYFHEPRFTSGPSGGGVMGDIWRVMYDAGVDLVLNGHDHGYERFARQDPEGRADAARCIHRRHRRRTALPVCHHPAEQRSPRQRMGRAQGHAPR